MSVKTFLTILAILALLYGVGDLLVPAKMGAIYGFEASRSSELLARFLGVSLLAWGLVAWFARDFHDDAAQHSILVVAGVVGAIGVIVSAMGVMSGVMNAMGWVIVLVYLFATVGSFYFLAAGSRHAVHS